MPVITVPEIDTAFRTGDPVLDKQLTQNFSILRKPFAPELIEPAFEVNWSRLSSSMACEFFKDRDNIVHFNLAMASTSLGTTAFYFPEGYRPALQNSFVGVSNSGFSRCYVAANGRFQHVWSTGNNLHFIVAGSFLAA